MILNTADPNDMLLVGRYRGYDSPSPMAGVDDNWGVFKDTDHIQLLDEVFPAFGSDATMKLVWDGTQFELHVKEDAGFQPLRTGISVTDWNMDAGSTFTLLVGASDTAVPIALDDGTKVYSDNFVLFPGPVSCGDVNDDGTVDGLDIGKLRSFLANPDGCPLAFAGQAKCNVITDPNNEPRPCDILDLVVLRRSTGIPPRPPGIAPVCEAAVGQ